MAALARSVTSQSRPVPFEGFDPDALLCSVQFAIDSKLIDDLSFLSAPAAAAALYELAAALPASHAKRELGKRVLHRLRGGNATTFIALATRLALGSPKALSGPGLHERMALSLELPIGYDAPSDAFALALVSRKELEHEWLTQPSTGSLPQRRLAARLLERAAREAAIRHAEGDDSGIQVFNLPRVRLAWTRLLSDREPMVWRHIATARGLLATSVEHCAKEILVDLHENRTPNEWRRAATSLTASMAVDPDGGLRRARQITRSRIIRKDPGIRAAMVLGLPRATESDPSAAKSLLEELVQTGGLGTAEALVVLRRERPGDAFGNRAAALARNQLETELAQSDPNDDGKTALIESLIGELETDGSRGSLPDRVAQAIGSFFTEDARKAHADALEVLELSASKVRELESIDESNRENRKRSFILLRELDLALLETNQLRNLINLRSRAQGSAGNALGDLFERMTHWLIEREGTPVEPSAAQSQPSLRHQRLRTMLHLIDADGVQVDERVEILRRRRKRAARVFLKRAALDQTEHIHQTLCATTSKSFDALIREEIAEASDIVLGVSRTIDTPEDVQLFAEASTAPEIKVTLSALVSLRNQIQESPRSGQGVRDCLDELTRFTQRLPIGSSPRVSALRLALLAFGRALEKIAAIGSLSELEGDGDQIVPELAETTQVLARLSFGASRRIGMSVPHQLPSSGSAIHLVDFAVDRVLRGNDRSALEHALEEASETLKSELPRVFCSIAISVLRRLGTLPNTAKTRGRPSFPAPRPKESPLPAWMPSSRTLGGFYVLRQLGSGAVGSVFVARRSDERTTELAERFALKVPEYDGSAARALSEDEFHALFRDEAGALLALPAHKNIARFVTFDAGAKPKPILVMELVEGPTLDRVLELGDLSLSEAFSMLDGVAAGLEEMHRVGVGHLDVKPGNVILREISGSIRTPVLVDFGLAGRHLRPGCATAEYGAPEIWNHRSDIGPTAADVYAFSCLVYEVVTGQTLFTASHEVAMIASHINHDGYPAPIAELIENQATSALGSLLATGLRNHPESRSTISTIRKGLSRIGEDLHGDTWPMRITRRLAG